MRTKDGKFAKGNPGKPKGAINKERRLAAEAIREIVEGRANRILDIADRLEDKDFMSLWLQLIEFVEPRLSRSQVDSTVDQTLIIKKEIKNGNESNLALGSDA